MSDKAAAAFVMRCFHARTTAHVLHLKTRSYAQHKALNDFYDGIIGLIDNFAEAWQGEYGLMENYPPAYTMHADGLSLMDDLAKWIETNRDAICDDTYCQNIIDEVVALVRTTQYKLKFLK